MPLPMIEACGINKYVMMRCWVIALVLVLSCQVPSGAVTLWSAGVSAEHGWHDFNKTHQRGEQGDNYLCWAVVAANLLAWWQEQNPGLVRPRIPVGEQIWAAFRASFENEGSDPDQGIRWWLSGNYVQQEPGDGQRCAALREGAAGGFYREQNLEPELLLYSGRGIEVTADALTAVLLQGFSRGDAFWLGASCHRADGSRFMHSITVWGIDVAIGPEGQEYIAAIYMCDSDDRARILHRIPLRRENGMLAFDCPEHPLYGPLGVVTLDTYTGMRRSLP